MALDTVTIKMLVNEINNKITAGKIEKVYQPENDEIVLLIKTFEDSYRLVMSANASHPRVHFTSVHKENPQKAPLFCMLMRKHLQSGKIIGIKQIENERIIRLDIDSYDELGDKTTKYLYCEIMGRHSNIILTKSDNTVIDSVKHIDFSVSSVRQILPGLSYTLPPKQEKTPILSYDITNILLNFNQSGKTSENVIMDNISGVSPLLVREFVYRAIGRNNIDCSLLADNDKVQINKQIQSIQNYKYCPCIIFDNETGKSIDFSCCDILQYEDICTKKYYNSISEMLDAFYKNRDNQERMKQKSNDLVHFLNTSIERVSKKLSILKKTIKDAEKKDEYKKKGDLLSSYIYMVKQGDSTVTVVDYFSEEQKEITITLNPMLTPSQNIQRFYKLYQKAKTAEVEAAKQFENASNDLFYFESTLVLTQNAQTEADLNAIRFELAENGYMKRRNQNKKQKNVNTSKPMHYISSDGFDIYVGKNNTQNDYLTLKFANSSDMWFHTKQIHGSHTIIKLGIGKEIPNQTIKEAAALAAYYSKARTSSNVPVDYTQIKNVKKPNGAKAGMVIYDKYNTIYINPSENELTKLSK